MITAVVGAGGKTTLIHTLADQFRREGKKVFVTTTTHMYVEPDTLQTDNADEILRVLHERGYVMAGLPFGEKICSLPQSVYEAVCHEADEVLVEADGSKHKAVKFPAPGEPAIPSNAQKIIVVIGLHALGKTVREAAFRQEEVMRCLGVDAETRLTPVHLQTLLQKGYLQPLKAQYPQAEICVHAAGATCLSKRAVGAMLEAGTDVGFLQRILPDFAGFL